MSKIFNNMRAGFTTALRVGIHARRGLPAVVGLGVMIVAASVSAQNLSTPNSTARNTHDIAQSVHATTASVSAQQEPMPQQAPPPSALEQPLTKPPQVSYEAGQLTIVAENSKLSDIMSSLRACMGADVDLPASASSQRIWARLGPGPARKILATLLSGTNLDYVIQASDTDPDGIRNVWLTTRTAGAAVTTARGGTPSGRPQPARDTNRKPPEPAPSAVEARPAEEPVTPEPAVATEVTPGAAPPVTPAAAAAPQPPSTDLVAASATQGSEADKPSDNPTEQMIHTLQNMYEQRKQMQLARTPQAPN